MPPDRGDIAAFQEYAIDHQIPIVDRAPGDGEEHVAEDHQQAGTEMDVTPVVRRSDPERVEKLRASHEEGQTQQPIIGGGESVQDPNR